MQTENKNKSFVFLHLSGLLPLFIPTLIIWHRKKKVIETFTRHYRAILPFQFTIWILFFLPGIFVYNSGGGSNLLIFGILFSVVSSVYNTFRVASGKAFKYFSFLRYDDIKQTLVLAILLFPIAFAHNYFHEFGHWLVGKLLGYDMGIKLNWVWPRQGHYNTDLHSAYVGMGGPAFSIIFALIFLLVIEKVKTIYAYPLVFYPLFARFFSLFIGQFSAQDEAGIAASLGLGTYTVAVIVLSLLLLIVLRAAYKLKIGIKYNALLFMLCFVVKSIEIRIIELIN